MAMSPIQLTRIIASHLRAWQKLKGYTESDMGRLLHISGPSYQRIIMGIAPPSLELICLMHEATEIPVPVLMTPLTEDVVPDPTRAHRALMIKLEECHALAVTIGHKALRKKPKEKKP